MPVHSRPKRLSMKVSKTEIADVIVLDPVRLTDHRGHFGVVWNAAQAGAAGLPGVIQQVNESLSIHAGTVRGLHYQAPPFAQAKLVRVLQGSVFDVAVDFRRGSPSFGRWVGVELTAASGRMLHVPRGFLHGFVTREANTVVSYFVDNDYNRASEGAIRFNDPAFGIQWGVAAAEVFISDKDAGAPAFSDVESPFNYGEVA